MSGRTPGRLGAVVALVAAAAFAGSLLGVDSGLHLMDFEWGAPAAHVIVDAPTVVEVSASTVR
ncbi:hypothetical protein DLJ46_07895 [Micromonospora globispora]|uniref:Uncharacterized protein n=1 Tax=Micromonospora globispora TaxID=1450148 RepID=A0A317KBQ5_9ACTN|nr:hypothetical protein DLJ46_07895 [Micromonospora globispora]RQW98283.1 hypothetical protein DKL51_10845 [Micromonospora globispora]